MNDGSPGQDFQLSFAALSIAKLSWNFAKLIWNPHASQGAPQAAQSADRFHLVKNLTEAVQKALVHCRAELQREPKRAEPVDPKAGRRVCTLLCDLGWTSLLSAPSRAV